MTKKKQPIDRSPEAQQERAEALAWADRVNAMEGLPEPNEYCKQFDAAVIAGDMTADEVIAILVKNYDKL